MVDEREAASHWLDPRLGEDWKLASWGWLPSIIPEKTSLPKTEQREVHEPRGRAATVVDSPKMIHLLLYDDQKRLGPSVYLDEQCTESTMPDGSDSSALRYKRDDGEELYLSIRG
ncbi:hypothetical protein FOVG_19427 [Fusarium oxysporum f. sp. pisi HDV247]|uniref:Uncharacterized protein n=1 Tax=Fusarium oxysporum f. sp. pisi HDV247 TaxID=1080344 RepID=W9NE63_FUSOX|nr:hypothetical protein FOVG_19427 [Fusarium oxysporum f. sp. pisi HDV247]